MAIAVYFNPTTPVSKAVYDSTIQKLGAAGAATPKGRSHHSSFGPDDALMVYEVWDSQADFEAFGTTLMPILGEAGIDPGEPTVMPTHNIIQ